VKTNRTARKVEVIQDEEAPVAAKVLAQAIVKISDAARAMARAGLTRRAIVILLSESSGVSRTQCACVLDSLENLAKEFCN